MPSVMWKLTQLKNGLFFNVLISSQVIIIHAIIGSRLIEIDGSEKRLREAGGWGKNAK